jgi:hypothetical protein
LSNDTQTICPGNLGLTGIYICGTSIGIICDLECVRIEYETLIRLTIQGAVIVVVATNIPCRSSVGRVVGEMTGNLRNANIYLEAALLTRNTTLTIFACGNFFESESLTELKIPDIGEFY